MLRSKVILSARMHMAVLPGLDMAGGGDQRLVPVIIHLIGGEGDRLIAVDLNVRSTDYRSMC